MVIKDVYTNVSTQLRDQSKDANGIFFDESTISQILLEITLDMSTCLPFRIYQINYAVFKVVKEVWLTRLTL